MIMNLNPRIQTLTLALITILSDSDKRAIFDTSCATGEFLALDGKFSISIA